MQGEEMMTWVKRANEEMMQPHSCFVPVTSVYSSREGDLWVVKLELPGDYWSLSAVAEGKAECEAEKCYFFIKSTLVAMLEAEQLLGPYTLEAEQLYIGASGHTFLSPLVSSSEKTTGLVYIMDVIKNRWNEEDLDLAFTRELFPYMDRIGQCADNQSLQVAKSFLDIEVTEHVVKTLKKLNKMMRKLDLTPFIQPYTPVVQMVLSAFPLTFTICQNPKCPGVETDKISICPQHYYCGEACRRACLRPGKAGCGLCGGYDACFCGKALSSEWRLPYLGSSEYTETVNYCSDACYQLKKLSNPSNSSATDSTSACLSCRKPKKADFKVTMDCSVHGFCSIDCYKDYIQEMVPSGFKNSRNCLECSGGIMELLDKYRVKEDQSRELIERIDSLRDNYLRTREPMSLTMLLNMINQVKGFYLQNLTDTSLPESLSFQQLHHPVYFLACCACRQRAYVHKRSKAEMLTWAGLPFLIKCEFNLHGVCSENCLEILREQSSGRCPVCLNSAINFAIAAAPRNKTHPTLEALRRTAGVIEHCQHVNSQFVALPGCAHEACTECMSLKLGRQESDSFTCPVCLQVASIEEIFKLA